MLFVDVFVEVFGQQKILFAELGGHKKLLFVTQLLHGAGAAPLYTLGVTYIGKKGRVHKRRKITNNC